MHRIAALFVVMLLVLSGGGNLADPAPVTPAPLLPLPGTPQAPGPLGGFRGLQPTPPAVTPGAAGESRFVPTATPPADLPPDTIYYESFDGYVPQAYWVGDVNAVRRSDTTGGDIYLAGSQRTLSMIYGHIEATDLSVDVTLERGSIVLAIRQRTAHDFYSVELSDTRLLTFRRGSDVLASELLSFEVAQTRLNLRLKAVESLISVEVDGSEVMRFADADPLGPGVTFFGTGANPQSAAEFDNALLRGTTAEPTSPAEGVTVLDASSANGIRSGYGDIVFSMDNRIYTLNGDGINLISRTDNGVIQYATNPTWSPDGTRIAFAAVYSGSYDIHVLTLATLTVTVYPMSDSGDSMPVWSPDGQHIAFISVTASTCRMARITDLVAGTHQVLWSGFPMNYPSYSPDGTMLVYARTSTGVGGNSSSLFTRPVAGGSEIQLTAAGHADDPEWSPDGSRIVFTALIPGTPPEPIGLSVIDADNSNAQVVTASGRYPSWIDSDSVTFTDNDGDIYAIDLGAGCTTPYLIYDGASGIGWPDWRPGAPQPTCSPLPTPTPIDRGAIPLILNPDYFPERTFAACDSSYAQGSTRYHCYVHVSLLDYLDYLSGVSITLTHRVLLEALVEGEYRSSIGFNPGIGQWGNEAVARQFYGACGSDGCKNVEIYSFLDYFQSPLAGTLDRDYRQVLRIRQTAQDPNYPGYQLYVDQLNDAVEQILIPEPSAWLFGPLNGQPYGYGTRGLFSPVPVGQADLTYWANLCGFAAATRSDAGVGQMFIGTTPETDKAFGGPCSWN